MDNQERDTGAYFKAVREQVDAAMANVRKVRQVREAADKAPTHKEDSRQPLPRTM